MLSEISQAQKDKSCMSHLHEVPRVTFVKTERRMVAPEAGGGRKEVLT